MRIPRPIYKLKRHQRATVAILLFIIPLVALYSAGSALAAASYSITPQAPGRIQEGQSIILTLSVTGGVGNNQYVFNVTVIEPDGSMHTALNVQFMTNPSGDGSVSPNYPTAFTSPTQGDTNLVGTYTIVVNQVTPTGAANPVATGSFTVGLTNTLTYQRTQTVLIQASGYGSGESVTVDINTNGGTTHANGFPMAVTATASGLVTVNWHIPFNVATGTWIVSAAGTTSKAPTDQQTFSVTIATMQVLATTNQTSYARTQTILAFATVLYPDGTVMNNSLTRPRITFDNGSLGSYAMTWDPVAQNWYYNEFIPEGIHAAGRLPQAWIVQVTSTDSAGNTGSGSVSPLITILLTPATPDLQVYVYNSTGASVSNVFLNITYSNGTLLTTAYTNATGSALFTLPEGDSYTDGLYSYWLIASHPGYNDYHVRIWLQGNLMYLPIRLSTILYPGSVLSGSFTTQANYIPGQSGQLEIWIYNQNTTFNLIVDKIEVQFPWFATYGNAYQGNVTVSNLPATIKPLTNWNITVPFTVPNDGRLYSGTGGAIYITAHITAWKTAWNIGTTGTPVSYKTQDTAYINPYNNAYYDSRGFLAYPRITVAFPTQDTAAAGDLNIIEILAGISILNVVFLALIWMRLKPQGAAAMPKA